jgi:hypothetical protein
MLANMTLMHLVEEEAEYKQDKEAGTLYDGVKPAVGWQGYIPKLHGKYDATKPYASYHSYLEWVKANPQHATVQAAAQDQARDVYNTDYSTNAGFNSRTGGFQRNEQNVDRHNDFNKSGRQMNAYFDVDAAANTHEGRSLKAERQEQKHSKKEIREMNAKRKEKKQAKRMAFLKS